MDIVAHAHTRSKIAHSTCERSTEQISIAQQRSDVCVVRFYVREEKLDKIPPRVGKVSEILIEPGIPSSKVAHSLALMIPPPLGEAKVLDHTLNIEKVHPRAHSHGRIFDMPQQSPGGGGKNMKAHPPSSFRNDAVFSRYKISPSVTLSRGFFVTAT